MGRARKQEYRITLRCNTACNFKLRALARAAGIPRTEVLRQLILNGSVRERCGVNTSNGSPNLRALPAI